MLHDSTTSEKVKGDGEQGLAWKGGEEGDQGEKCFIVLGGKKSVVLFLPPVNLLDKYIAMHLVGFVSYLDIYLAGKW